VSAHREILAKPPASTGLFFSAAFVVATALAAVAAAPARAQEGRPATPEACVGLAIDADRLACYDRVFGRDRRPGAAEPPAAGEPAELLRLPSPPSESPDPSEPGDAPAVARSLLDSRWELSRNAKLGIFGLRSYKPVYLLPSFYTDSPNQQPSSPAPDHSVDESQLHDRVEAKFQLGFKTKVWQGVVHNRGDLWFGYTQSSRWQVYNGRTSRAFRETNYEPELMMVVATNYKLLGFDGRLAGVSLNHQSNGRENPLSRSWNRIIGMVGFERGGWTVVARPWWRIPEPEGDDDNPDIEDYAGRADLQVVHRLQGHELSLMLRHSLRGGGSSHGAAELGWSFPIHGDLKGYLQLFHGYGESLIDYNQSATRIGLGISLLEWY
jgi:phospholipase A1/A2